MAVFETGEQIFAIAPTWSGRFKAFGKVLLFLFVMALLAAGLTIGGLLIMHMTPQSMAANPSAPASLLINEVGLAGGGVIATVLMAVIFREAIGKFGFGLGQAARRRGRDLLIGGVTGFVLLTALLGVIAALGGYDFGHVADTPMQALQFGGLYLLLFCLVAIGEEFMVRGYALVQMSRAMSFWPAAILLSVLFGAMHAGNAAETPVGLASAGLIGFVFCYSFYRSGSLMWALGFHAAWDYAQSFVWGVPDSGIVTPGALFVSKFHGADWLTGGSAGPEASWLIAPIILVSAAAAHFILKPPGAGRLPLMRLEAWPLEGRFARLEPFTDALHDEVRAALDVDPDAWDKLTLNGRGEAFDGWWADAISARGKGQRIPFAIRRLADGRVLGSSSYLSPNLLHRTVEIGATFLHPDARGGPVNPQAKRLLLANAFEAGALRVELITDTLNTHSQSAIAKLGAVREGTLRNHRVTWTGRVRDTVVFSITDAEWPKVRDGLDERLRAFA